MPWHCLNFHHHTFARNRNTVCLPTRKEGIIFVPIIWGTVNCLVLWSWGLVQLRLKCRGFNSVEGWTHFGVITRRMARNGSFGFLLWARWRWKWTGTVVMSMSASDNSDIEHAPAKWCTRSEAGAPGWDMKRGIKVTAQSKKNPSLWITLWLRQGGHPRTHLRAHDARYVLDMKTFIVSKE